MTELSNSLGIYKSHTSTSHGLHIETDNGMAQVTVYDDTTVRIHVTKAGQAPDLFSYAVCVDPQETPYRLNVSNSKLELATDLMTLIIFKDPLRFHFLTAAGQVLSEDDSAFGTSWIGEEVSTYRKLQGGERFIGLGEKTGPLDRAGSAYVNWNTGTPIISAIRWMATRSMLRSRSLSVSTAASRTGFSSTTPTARLSTSALRIDRFSSFSADSGDMSYYFIHDTSVRGIIAAYTRLTGRMELPTLWALGYQQCRYSYYPACEVLDVARSFRTRDIPADTIYMDIHHMEGYKVFTWDPQHFADPLGTVAELREMGFHVVVILDPGIKVEPGYTPYEEGKSASLFLTYPDGTEYTAGVWPGWCHFPDFTKPETRDWWGRQLSTYVDAGVDGFWNDMNEPATWGQQMPNLIEFDYEGARATHRKARNVYGMQMSRSTLEGARKLLDGRRPFVLTRAGYAGVQRYSAVWTGDNIASDEHMLAGVRLVNSLGLAGIPFAAYDIGGFAGEASPALFARWLSIGAFAPLARGHSMINSRDAEPWSFGEEVEAIARNYLKLRYRLLPYLYSTFRDSSQGGLPVARSLAIDYTHDEKVYEAQYHNQYLFGESILVAPLDSTRDIGRVYLPEGTWYDLYDDRMYRGAGEVLVEAPVERLPVFVGGGAIIPVQEAASHTGEDPGELLQLHLYRSCHIAGSSSFTYYEAVVSGYKLNSSNWLETSRSSLVGSWSEKA